MTQVETCGGAGPLRLRLLVVDDHSTNRLVLTRLAATIGYAVDGAADGEKGLREWRRGRHALVLADCNMPVMDGYEMVRRIRREEAVDALRPRTAIIAFTSPATAEDTRRWSEAGMDDCLRKPTTPALLQALLARWLQR